MKSCEGVIEVVGGIKLTGKTSPVPLFKVFILLLKLGWVMGTNTPSEGCLTASLLGVTQAEMGNVKTGIVVEADVECFDERSVTTAIRVQVTAQALPPLRVCRHSVGE